MSSRDATSKRSQPQRTIVVSETSDSSPDGLGSRLDSVDAESTVRTVSDPVAVLDLLAETTPDCVVCEYHSETTAATESLYERLSRATALPLIGYVESMETLTRAYELGFTTVHLRRDHDDMAVLAEHVRAAIETASKQATTERSPQQVVAASIDTAGTVRRAATYPPETADIDDHQSLWAEPWLPTKAAVDTAIQRATATPGRPAPVSAGETDCDMLIVADSAAQTDETGDSRPRLTMVAVRSLADGDRASQPSVDSSSGRTIEYETVQELYRTLTTTGGSVGERIQELLRVGQSHLDIETGIVATVDDETYEIEQISSEDHLLGTVRPGDRFALSDTFCERTLADEQTHSVTGVTTDHPEYGDRAVVSEFGACQYLGTPLSVDDGTVGTLCFVGTGDRAHPFGPQDRLLTEFLSQLVSYELQQHADNQALEATRTELTELFDRIDDAFYSLDRNCRFTYINDHAKQLLETPASELIGESIWKVFPELEEAELNEQFMRAIDTGSSTSLVVEFESLDSWFDVTAYPSASGLSVYFRDVSDQKQRTADLERYEQILETVSDGVYALDPKGHFTYVNQGLADLTGYSRSELVGSDVSIFKSESTVDWAELALRQAISQAESNPDAASELSLDLEIETADGRTVPCTDHIALLPFDDRFRGSVGTLRDVSAQRQRERTLSGLLTVTRALMAAETTGDVAAFVVEAVSEVLGHDRAVVHLVDEDSEVLIPEAATELVHEDIDTLSTAVTGSGPIGSVYASGTPSRYDADEAAGIEFTTCSELLSVPLGSYGTLTVGADEPNAFSEADRQLLQLLTANAEEALNRTNRRQTLQRYEQILESVQEMICVVDSAGRIKLLTDPLAARLGADPSELIGHPLSSILDDSDDESTGPLAELFGTRSIGDITFKDALVVGNRESIPVSIEASQLPAVEGRPEAVVTLHDISDLISAKEAAAAERERFMYLFENLADPVDEISVGTDEPTIKAVNRAFRLLFGQPDSSNNDGSTETDELPPVALETQQIVESETQGSLRAEFESETDRELKLATEDGTKYFLYRSVPYELDDGLRGFEIYTDITALKQREIQLQVLHRLLRHNLRNDLNVIEGFAEILTDELDDETHQQFAARIRSNATQLVELSETAKTIESVAGHRSLDREPIALGRLVRSTVETYTQLYDEADIRLEAPIESTVSAGPHLETALAELVENAIEHNDAEQPQVSMSLHRDESTATVTIQDNGPGIPSEEWAVVTGDREISQLEHGSGLGLWLVRWVTEAYGGELIYHGRQVGSTISVRLPRFETGEDSR